MTTSLSSVVRKGGEPPIVRIAVEFGDAEAWQVAQFLKRLRFSQCRELATSDEEAHIMLFGLGKLQSELAEAGYAPR